MLSCRARQTWRSGTGSLRVLRVLRVLMSFGHALLVRLPHFTCRRLLCCASRISRDTPQSSIAWTLHTSLLNSSLLPVGTKHQREVGQDHSLHGLRWSTENLKKSLHPLETVAIMRVATRFPLASCTNCRSKKGVECKQGSGHEKNRLLTAVGFFIGRTIHVGNRRIDFEFALLI